MVALSWWFDSKHFRTILHSPSIDDDGHLPLVRSTFVKILCIVPAFFSVMYGSMNVICGNNKYILYRSRRNFGEYRTAGYCCEVQNFAK